MIIADVKNTKGVKLDGQVIDQILEFAMITRSLKRSFPEEAREKLPEVFNLGMVLDDDWEIAKKLYKMIFEEEGES